MLFICNVIMMWQVGLKMLGLGRFHLCLRGLRSGDHIFVHLRCRNLAWNTSRYSSCWGTLCFAPRLGEGIVLRSRQVVYGRAFGTSMKEGASNKKSAVKRLIGLAASEKWTLGGAMGLLLVSSAVTMAVPFCVGRLIDLILGGGSEAELEGRTQRLHAICGVLTAVFLAGAVCNGGRVYLINAAGQRITRDLRTRSYGTLLRQEVAFFGGGGIGSGSTAAAGGGGGRAGELVTRLTADTALVSAAITQNLSDGLRSAVMATAAASMMVATSTQLALVGLAVVPPVVGAAVLYGRYVRKITHSVQEALGEAAQVAEERLAAMPTVRAFGAEEKEKVRYGHGADRILELALQEARAKALFFGLTGLSGNLVVLAVLYHGGTLVTAGDMSIGSLSAFLLYAAYMGVAMSGLSTFYSELNRGLGAVDRLAELQDRKPQLPLTGGVWPTEPPAGEVSFERVWYAYPGRDGPPVLRELDLRLPAGQVTALVGASGSGKSTVGALLLGLRAPTAGQITLDGRPMSQLDPRYLRAHSAAVLQDSVLFSGSIRDNLLYGCESEAEPEQHLEHALDLANALEFVRALPHGLDTEVGERGAQLSGGQRQRLALARALLKEPRILLLDEATSALDADSEAHVQAALANVLRGRTVLIIAHRLSTVRAADQIAVLESGRVAEQGSYAELCRRPGGVFSQLVARQALLSTSTAPEPTPSPAALEQAHPVPLPPARSPHEISA